MATLFLFFKRQLLGLRTMVAYLLWWLAPPLESGETISGGHLAKALKLTGHVTREPVVMLWPGAAPNREKYLQEQRRLRRARRC